MVSRLLIFRRVERGSKRGRLPDSGTVDIESPDMIAHRRDKEDIMCFSVGHLNAGHIKGLRFNARIIIDLKGLDLRQAFTSNQSGREMLLTEVCPCSAII